MLYNFLNPFKKMILYTYLKDTFYTLKWRLKFVIFVVGKRKL